jgi:hypothetical protein
MIRISCTNCKTVLSIDDAFAGGVCRCQHCGTIQTVPSAARHAAQVAPTGQSIGGSKSLYQNNAAADGTGLDDLVGAVVSSGLSSTRLTKKPGSTGGKNARQNLMPIVIAATVIVALLLVIIIILISRNTGTVPGPGNQTSNSASVPAVAANTPSFCGTALQGDTIIYLLDCGGATKDYLGELKDAAIRSIGSLGSDRKFQILFWNNGTDGAYPQDNTTYANKENIAAAQKAIDDVAPFGQSDVKAALALAIARHPDTIVLATGKGWDLNNAWLDSVMSIRGASNAKFLGYSLGASGESAPLKKLAEQTGGSYHEMTQAQLRSFGE